jgi:shikimate kinase
MAVGKTTVGRALALRLGRDFHDSDERVELVSGRPVGDFFGAGEEAEFRRLEAQAVAELVELGEVVIALGGGALLDPGTREVLRRRALLVHLDVPWAVLSPRLAELAESRPLLRGRSPAEVRRLYLKRLATYRSAPIQVNLADPGVDAAVELVVRALMNPSPD